MKAFLLRPGLLRLLGLLCCYLLSGKALAQHDVILRNDGREISAKVLVVAPEFIRYLPRDTATSDTLSIAPRQVFMIRYANGTKEVIRQSAAETRALGLSKPEAIRRGRDDARRYYRAPGAFWGTYGATLVFPPAGLATGLVVAALPPSRRTALVPDATLLGNPDYMRSYQQQAQRRKAGRAAAGFGAGLGTLVVVIGVILSSVY